MQLTSAQLATLKSNITANAATIGQTAINTRNAPLIAAFYNAVAAPAFIVWRNDIKVAEFVAQVVGTEYVALTAQQQDTLKFYMLGGVIDASAANVRAVFSQLFAAGTATRTNLIALAKRSATVGEKLFATGTGTDASPAVAGPTGLMTPDNVLAALDS